MHDSGRMREAPDMACWPVNLDLGFRGIDQEMYMPSPETMREVMCRYREGVQANDVEGVIALFSDDVSVEDPVGGPAGTHVVGREAVSSFFRKGFAQSRPSLEPAGPIVTTATNEAAMPFTLQIDFGGRRNEIDVVDVMRFDEAGRITALRAFWNAAEARPA
jgi:steroid delta-isomerase